MAASGRRLADAAATNLRVHATTDLVEAVDGADFAISSIGGSGAGVTPNVCGSYFHHADVRLAAKYGVHQVIGDTCGPAGMMMGLRAIPVYLQICREMEKRCPQVTLLNHSNPMAVLMRALHKYTSINAIGICHGVQVGIAKAAALLDLPAEELECVWVGTNHYYWFTRVVHRGKDMLPVLFQRMNDRPPPKNAQMSRQLSQIYHYCLAYPSADHAIEFYPFLAQVARQGELPYDLAASARQHGYDEKVPWPSAGPPSPAVRTQFLTHYQAILDAVGLPDKMDTSITGERTASLISAIANGKRQLCIVNLANKGAIPNLPATAEVEVEAVTDSGGVRPLLMGEAPLVLKGLLEKRFVWHELVVDAAIKGDRNLALRALLSDEMAIWPEKARAMLEEMLTASKNLLPQFFG